MLYFLFTCDKLVQNKVKPLEEKTYHNARLPSEFASFPISVTSLLNLFNDKNKTKNKQTKKTPKQLFGREKSDSFKDRQKREEGEHIMKAEVIPRNQEK